MNYDLLDLILKLVPGALLSINGNSYEGIIWQDPNHTKPTLDEIEAYKPVYLLSKAKEKKKTEIFNYFNDRRDTGQVSQTINLQTYTFKFDYSLLTRLNAHILNSSLFESLYIWLKSEDGIVRLSQSDVSSLNNNFQSWCNENELLIDYNFQQIDALTSVQDVQNYQRVDTLPAMYS